MAADAERIAVIVGVGQVNDRPADPLEGLDSLGLMVAALEAADHDAGGGWLGDVESVAVVQQISFRQDNPLAQKVADRI
ncbi:MAG: acetyl-CoA acetyltransferase, partial [Sphingomonas sp.]|nr:acetyl-CoA acetyltransferase [Sphingomonas sp.]